MADVTNEHIAGMLSEIREDIRVVKRHVDGGSDPDRGLNTRVRLLEHDAARSQETARNARGVAWGALATAASAAVLWAWNELMGKKP